MDATIIIDNAGGFQIPMRGNEIDSTTSGLTWNTSFKSP